MKNKRVNVEKFKVLLYLEENDAGKKKGRTR
jgi:hypothetical protein